VEPVAPVTEFDKSADAPVYWPQDLADPRFLAELKKAESAKK